MESAKIEFRQTRDFSEIINASFAFIRQNFKKLTKCILFIVGPLMLAYGVVAGLSGPQMLMSTALGLGSYYTSSMVLFLIAAVLLSAVVYHYIVLYMDRDIDAFDIEDVWQGVKKDFFKILVCLIGVGLASFFGAFLCLLPGVYLYVALSLTLIALVRERLPIGRAFSRSFELISGYWWFTFGLIVVVVIIQGFLSMIFYIPQYTLTILTAIHANEGSSLTAGYRYGFIVTSLLASFGYYMFYSIPVITLAFHYSNLVERKEAKGLSMKVDEMGAQDEG
ncbi:hypothetical protein MJD09_02445 [bacterium]|nr:hypothetical protein [bacterium]